MGAGVTPAVHSHGPAPLAPVVSADRECAQGRVNSDRAVDRPCSRLTDLRDRIPARRPGVPVLAGLTPKGAVGFQTRSGQHGRSVPAP